MKVTVINKQATGEPSLYLIDGTQLASGAQHEMLARSKEDLLFQIGLQDDNVAVLAEIEGSDRAPIVNTMKTPADPGSGVATCAACGFDLLTEVGGAAGVAPQMYMGVFSDALCQTPSTTGTLDTAATGTIDDGDGTNLIKCTPDATGEFSVTLTDTADETVYLKAWIVGIGYIVDSSSIDEVTFTA